MAEREGDASLCGRHWEGSSALKGGRQNSAHVTEAEKVAAINLAP
jgi:hypothetical protein